MLLSKIRTDPAKWQRRSAPYSERTVAAIVAEGIDPARFDPIPLIGAADKGGKYVVAGDGHSRIEAIERLLRAGRGLPQDWLRRRRGHVPDVEIPHRFVNDAEAQMLSWTANMGRHEFTPAEEAAVFREMIDCGMRLELVAARCHRSPAYVTRALPLNTLARDIAGAVGLSPEAGGIDVLTAQVLAAGFARHGIEPAAQQELWHRCLKHAMLNFQSARKFVESIGGKLGRRAKSDDMLFELPANATAVLAEARDRISAYRSARTAICMLIKSAQAGGLDHLPELRRWLDDHGGEAARELAGRLTEDGEIPAAMVAA